MGSALLIASGGLGIFLLGMVVMTRGLRSLADVAIQKALSKFTRSPVSGAATGAVTTAIIQSSSATTVAAVGFVGAGLLTFPQALGIIFGANIGTTITGWFVAILGFKLKIGELAMPLILIGVMLHLFGKRRLSQAGFALAGFGLIFVGIDALQDGMAALEGVVTPSTFPQDTLSGRVLLVLIGVAITLVTQSSSAGVATALAAVHAGTISFPQAAAMVIGMDVGTTATAAIATIGGSTDARRTGFAHVIYNVLTGLGAFLLLTPYVWACDRLAPGVTTSQPELALVAFHTVFNLLGVVAALPFTNQFAELIMRLVPDRSPAFTSRLETKLLDSPSVAMEAIRATLEELTSSALTTISAILRSGPTDALHATLASAEDGILAVGDYLERIEGGDDITHERRAAALHAVDHLGRLIDRCDQAERIRLIAKVPALTAISNRLQESLTGVLAPLKKPYDESERAAEALRDEIKRECREFRRELIRNAAQSELETEAVIAKLDASRWLHREAHHIWRVVHYLQRLNRQDVKETERTLERDVED